MGTVKLDREKTGGAKNRHPSESDPVNEPTLYVETTVVVLHCSIGVRSCRR